MLEGRRMKFYQNRGEIDMGDVMRTISPTQRKSLEFVRRELSDGEPKEVVELQMKARAEGIPPPRKILGCWRRQR
jgi:hypothetical protein